MRNKFSLKSELKKRRTQEIQRAVEEKRIAAARGNDPRRSESSTPVTATPVAPQPIVKTTSQPNRTISVSQSHKPLYVVGPSVCCSCWSWLGSVLSPHVQQRLFHLC